MAKSKDTDRIEALEQALRSELEYLWHDLEMERRASRATPPEQSIGCLNLIERIQDITKLVGPTPPEALPMPFLLDGVYDRVHADIGVSVTVPPDLIQKARDYIAEAKRKFAGGLSA